jgi:CRP/FNR family transcriptional regulator, anaerobic regulatory protein
MAQGDLDRLKEYEFRRHVVKRGEHLFQPGDAFECLYDIHGGFFKATLLDADGREQISGFFMEGELLGMDGMDGGFHRSRATALDDGCVCVLPFARIQGIAQTLPSLQRALTSYLAREIVRGYRAMLLLGSMNARERLAAFLLDLVRRLQRRGYSASEIMLRMTREEIGSHLGLQVETVSRCFSALQKAGVVAIEGRHVVISDIDALERCVCAERATVRAAYRPVRPAMRVA